MDAETKLVASWLVGAHSGYLRRREWLKTCLQQSGLSVDTIHGPRVDAPDGPKRLEDVARAAADLGAAVVVTHPGPFGFDESELPERLKALLDACMKLETIAGETGVVFALENVLPGPATELARQALRQLSPRHFGFCYDSSHEQIDGPRPFALLDTLGERLVAVHLSDRVREFVDHVPPGEGFLDWAALTAALRRTPFAGPLLFEVMVTHAQEKKTRPFLKLAYERARFVHSLLRSSD